MMFNKIVLISILIVFCGIQCLFSLDPDVRLKTKDDIFYKLYGDDYTIEMIEFLEKKCTDLEWADFSGKDRKKVEILRKKLKEVLDRREQRKSTIATIFNRLSLEPRSDVKILKNVNLSTQDKEIENKREMILESLKKK